MNELINVGNSLEDAVRLGDREYTQYLVDQIKYIIWPDLKEEFALYPSKDMEIQINITIYVARLLFIAKYVPYTTFVAYCLLTCQLKVFSF